MTEKIPFNKPFIAGRELHYVAQTVTLGNIAGDGHFTQRCCEILEQRFGIEKVLLTPSCTAALEMAMILLEVGPGDEVVLPSFTFVSTANAFVQRGARPVFVDVRPDTLNIDENQLEAALTDRTKVILPIHYAGVAAEMDEITRIAAARGIPVVEDAAQGVNGYYRGRALGSIGTFGAYSFHATKNYTCGEGGALCINDSRFIGRAEIVREKGTDRSRFLRGEVDKYTWVDIGSSYVPSELASAFLCAQLELLDPIAARRREIYELYDSRLRPLEERGLLQRPVVPEGCQSNYHMYFVLLPERGTRDRLIEHLRAEGISTVFHYLPLHDSPMGQTFGYQTGDLPVTEDIAGRVLRLPFFYDITEPIQQTVVDSIGAFLGG